MHVNKAGQGLSMTRGHLATSLQLLSLHITLQSES